MIKQSPTTQTIIPAIPAVAAVAAIAADLTVVPPILAVPAVAAIPAISEVTFYEDFRNMIENYSSDNLKIAMINASVTWGDNSFTLQMPQMINEMTIANGLAMTPTNLKPSKSGEILQLTRMHSKFMAHQVMALLTPTACQAVQQLKGLYTWCTPDGKEDEMDGPTVLAIIFITFDLTTKLTCILKSMNSRRKLSSNTTTILISTSIVFATTRFRSIRRTQQHILTISLCENFLSNV